MLRRAAGRVRAVVDRHADSACSTACATAKSSTALVSAACAWRCVETTSALPGSNRNSAAKRRISTFGRFAAGIARSHCGQCGSPRARSACECLFHAAAVKPDVAGVARDRVEEEGGGTPSVTCRLPVRMERDGTADAIDPMLSSEHCRNLAYHRCLRRTDRRQSPMCGRPHCSTDGAETTPGCCGNSTRISAPPPGASRIVTWPP
ncbi:hypothetical protein D3C81_1430810 [compost metagenome]